MGCCGSSERWALKVEVLKATGLPDMDIRGKGDPYCEVEPEGEDKQKTETIKNNQNPEWNQTFVFENVKLGTKVAFRVFDWDRLTSNDLIGANELSAELPQNYNECKEITMNLMHKDGNDRGQLHVKVTFIHEAPQ